MSTTLVLLGTNLLYYCVLTLHYQVLPWYSLDTTEYHLATHSLLMNNTSLVPPGTLPLYYLQHLAVGTHLILLSTTLVLTRY